MARKRKSGLEYWQENCRTCSKFVLTKLIVDGVDDGGVRYSCSTNDKEIIPHKVDNCKNYDFGEPTVNTDEVIKKK